MNHPPALAGGWFTFLCYNFASSYYSRFFKKGTKWTQLTMTNILQCQEISQVKELISYLKSQVKSNLDKPRFYTTENAPSLKALRAEVKKMPQEQVEKIKAEVNAEMFGTENV